MLSRAAEFPRSRRRGVARLLRHLASLCLALCAAEFAAANGEALSQAVSYADASDEQLTALAARWDSLGAAQRRALLSEVKMRMARSQGLAKGGSANGVLRIRLTRRYGTVPHGRTAGQLHFRLEARPANAEEFGVGFEQRAGQPQAADQDDAERAAQGAAQQVSGPR